MESYKLDAILALTGLIGLGVVSAVSISRCETTSKDSRESNECVTSSTKIPQISTMPFYSRREKIYAIKPEEETYPWEYSGFWKGSYLPKV